MLRQSPLYDISLTSDMIPGLTQLAKTTADTTLSPAARMTDTSNHAHSKADSARERELYRYYHPNSRNERNARQRSLTVLPDDDTVTADGAISPDNTLTALAQLAAIRLNAQRAMVSVLDKEHQYFIAESTKSLDISDSKKFQDSDDGLWIGCSRVRKEGRLCEKTLELKPVPGEFPCFVVTDLSKDARFNQLPFVTGPPFFRYYAGTPLTTKIGVNIGSLFILDIVARPVLTAQQQAFLGSIAQVIVGHMEVFREAEERKKVMRMSRGLNAFVEGKSALSLHDSAPRSSILNRSKGAESDQIESLDSLTMVAQSKNTHVIVSDGLDDGSPAVLAGNEKACDKFSPASGTLPTADTTRKERISPTDQDASQSGSEDEPQTEKADTGHQRTIKRAAYLLHQSLDLQLGGGVVYLDTMMNYHGRRDNPRTNPRKSYMKAEDYFEAATSTLFDPPRRKSGISSPEIFIDDANSGPLDERKPQNPAGIISLSVSKDCMGVEDGAIETAAVTSFTPLGEDTLQYFMNRYPRGNLWSFDEDGSLLASEGGPTQGERRTLGNRASRSQKTQLIARMLRKHFPAVRQLLFAPLWDSGALRWFSGCFVFNNSNVLIFSRETELNFVMAFNNSVMAEVSRLTSIAADRQKSDFIGSISHELRSPLHGILASADFLADTEPDVFQTSLINTVLSCGRTLLDTINHILDFCKINSFERNWQNVRNPGIKPRRDTSKAPLRQGKGSNPLMNLFAITDVAAVTEEVIEGVFVGQVYQDIGSSGIADGSSESLKRVGRRLNPGFESTVGAASGRRSAVKEIEVILDIAQEDFTFTTQPGALRRVIMNIFGNAVKYTEKGTILVKLSLISCDEIDADPTPRMLEIKIEDTGKGISADYLRTRLYTPFCQEDVLASGTGLGLSIVRSIVTMLDGTIAIRSQVGQGTEVKICIPMMRAPRTESVSTATSATTETLGDDPIQALQNDYPGKTASLHGLDQGTETSRVLENYISRWFGFEIISSWPTSRPVDIIIVDESIFSDLLETNSVASSVIVLCSNVSRFNQKGSYAGGSIPVEFMSRPFGPYKLAKALRLCLEKAKKPGTAQGPLNMRSADSARLPARTGPQGGAPLSASINPRIVIDAQFAKAPVENGAIHSQEFPFPYQEKVTQISMVNSPAAQIQNDVTQAGSERPKIKHRFTEPIIRGPYSWTVPFSEVPLSTPRLKPASPPVTLVKEKHPPRLLLVDDNLINLRLLETYMRKRKLKFVDSAQNGLLAVQATERNPDGYDIIFMDISMPVMNGFEATRAIRKIEHDRGIVRSSQDGCHASSSNEWPDPESGNAALIIALTGLASDRDQKEAFRSGVDMFLTKPVSFKDVGTMLDHWEAHCGYLPNNALGRSEDSPTGISNVEDSSNDGGR